MSSSPSKAKTYDVDFTREQAWIAHHRVVTQVDESLAAGSQPPAWLVDLFERLETGADSITGRQAAELQRLLADYVEDTETPADDERVATALIDELPTIYP
ncbi:hypothetical protein Halru_0661 [Halovivax ruber XH-70]|uniref:Uncharacterized protein n=1 Tax=Halovivax ruber (strain DSM 18193 / JCM 13892 / XH-70) TaxID=797302 RepID=L0I925_HALRX|nr:hypothetical protein [Halovivax ruber]AGB15288.1 hypothetical protein Halru_0661 [Halovivax ruber XH-70]